MHLASPETSFFLLTNALHPVLKRCLRGWPASHADADSSEIKDHTHDNCTPSSGTKEIFFPHRNLKILMITATWKVFAVEGKHPPADI